MHIHESEDSKIVALSRARVCLKHVFLTEKDPTVAAAGKRVSEAMGSPAENLLPDMRTRMSFKKSGLDLYVCSPPCQSFSSSGLGKAGRHRFASCMHCAPCPCPDRDLHMGEDLCFSWRPRELWTMPQRPAHGPLHELQLESIHALPAVLPDGERELGADSEEPRSSGPLARCSSNSRVCQGPMISERNVFV